MREGGCHGGGRGVCDNEKRRTTSVFARCSFCDPYLALRHGRLGGEEETPGERWKREKEKERERECMCRCNTHTRIGKQKERSRQKKCCTRRLFTHVSLRAFVFLRVCAGSYSFRFMPFMHASMLR